MAWEEGISISTRQRCGVCHQVAAVNFKVPDDLWLRAVPSYFRQTPMCISCFASFADERMLTWCADITFYPKSLAAHRGALLRQEVSEPSEAEQATAGMSEVPSVAANGGV